MPPFWDPYCPPLGITSLQAYLRSRGHQTAIFDFNTDASLWRSQRAYYDLLIKVVPDASKWNIMRLGPDYFSRHQMAWRSLRDRPSEYRDLSAHILNIDGRQTIDWGELDGFDGIFEAIYARIDLLLDAQLARHRPTLIGCTLLTTTMPAALHILERAKAADPDVRTVLGGPGPIMGAGADSPDTERILELCPFLDNIVIGEGEVLIERLHRGGLDRRRIYSLRDVPAAADGEAPELAKGGLIKHIAELPTPDYDGLSVPNYFNLSVGVSRGCAYSCSFCYETTFWKRYRKRPMESALRDLQRLRTRYDRTNFFLCDSLTNLFAEDLADGVLERGLDVRWDGYLRADAPLMDARFVEHLADGGMIRARIGVESADPETLTAMDKRTTVDVMSVVLERLAAAGIQTSTLWIVGFPTEDDAAFENSLRFLRDHADLIYAADPWQFIFHPTVGPEPVFGRLVAEHSFETRYGMRRLYPEEYDAALLVQYYELDVPDVMATKIDRLERMSATIAEAGIPNPYSMGEWRAANSRWRAMHPPRPAPARAGAA
jgi:radical SAM superfamily enzyme YgiQ (UPF0313 family)